MKIHVYKLYCIVIKTNCIVFYYRHECPCCKAELSTDDVISDTGFDALIRKSA